MFKDKHINPNRLGDDPQYASATKVQTSEVDQALSEARVQAEQVITRVGILFDRLEPILRPAGPAEAYAHGDRSGYITPLARDIADLASRAEMLDRALREVIERLGI